jgi:hypothetical protein
MRPEAEASGYLEATAKARARANAKARTRTIEEADSQRE